jgi:acyl carrier protein
MADETVTLAQALDMFAEIFEFPVAQLTLDTTQAEIAGWDSMGVLSMMAEFDSRFGITLTSNQLDSLKSIGNLIDVLKSNNKIID